MTKYSICTLIVLLFTACNQKNDFPDFDYVGAYFPVQTPVRTLILGTYSLADNSLDNNHQFNIGINIGGLYENIIDRKASFIIDESIITDKVAFNNGDTVKVLPAKYYTTEPASGSDVIIPKGSMVGKILVTLKPAFFLDLKALKTCYVIPVKIMSVEKIDKILSGTTRIEKPNILNPSDWDVAPKNYTLFGIKYVNEYHGNYLHYGKDVTLDAAGQPTSTVVTYSNYFLERNQIWLLKNTGRFTVETAGVSNALNSTMSLTINTDNTISIKAGIGLKVVDSAISKGNYKKDGGEWGGQKRDVMYLHYFYTESSVKHEVSDTLLFRDKNVVFETFQYFLRP
jgi:hypothetical protein